MIQTSVWNALVSCLRRAHEIQAARAEKQRLRAELKRLLSSGDHLILDLGLDPGHVRAWLKEGPRSRAKPDSRPSSSGLDESRD